MSVIDKNKLFYSATEKIIGRFVEDLKSKGMDAEAAAVASGNYDSEVARTTLVPKLLELENEIELRIEVMNRLEMKKELAMGSGKNNEVGKLTIAIAEAEQGVFDLPFAAKVYKELVAKSKRKVSDMDLQEIIDTYNFHMVSEGGLFWYYQPLYTDEFGNRGWVSIKKDTLLANFAATNIRIRGGQGEPDYNSFNEFCKMLADQGKVFQEVNQSYKPQIPGVLNIMEHRFAEPSEDESFDYHWIFDAVLEVLSGDEPGSDAFTALQSTIFSKWVNPDNPYLPHPMIVNNDGRAGKDLISQTFLRTLFCGSIAPNCGVEHLLGKFNSVIAGKAIIVVNESSRDKVDAEKMRSFMGSPTFWVEEKFERPYQCANTALVLCFTNLSVGSVTLRGTLSDERYSIFNTSKNVYDVIAKYMLAKEGVEMTQQEVKEWIQGTGATNGQMLLKNAEQVGKWLTAMVMKYGELKTVPPYHGEAYATLIDRQRGAWTETVEQVFTDPNFVYIRDELLERLIREFNKGEAIPGRKYRKEEITRMCKDKGINVYVKDRALLYDSNGNTIQRTVWVPTTAATKIQIDEDRYGCYDEHNKWIWNWIG